MVVGLLGNKSPDSNRFTLVTPKSENDVRLQATLGNQNPMGLLVGAVRERSELVVEADHVNGTEIPHVTTLFFVRPYENKACRCPICNKKCKVKLRMPQSLVWKSKVTRLNTIANKGSIYLTYAPNIIECEEHGEQKEKLPWEWENYYEIVDPSTISIIEQ